MALTDEQEKALGKLMGHERPVFLAGNLGSGKTRVALELFQRQTFLERMVVLFPCNSLRQTWNQEVEKWLPEDGVTSNVPDTTGQICLGTFRMLLQLEKKRKLGAFASSVNRPSTLVVIDESHTMRQGIDKETLEVKPTYRALKAFCHGCPKARVVFLSATHRVETAFDSCSLEHCVNPNMELKQWQLCGKRKARRPATASTVVRMKGKEVAPMEVVVVEHDCFPEETTLYSLWERRHRKLRAAMQGSRGTNHYPQAKAAFMASLTMGKRGAQHPTFYNREFVNTKSISVASSKFEALTRLFKAHSLRLKPVVIMGEWLEPLRLLEAHLRDNSSSMSVESTTAETRPMPPWWTGSTRESSMFFWPPGPP